jgi:hypothetical protein
LGEVGSRPSGSRERLRADTILGRGLLTSERLSPLQVLTVRATLDPGASPLFAEEQVSVERADKPALSKLETTIYFKP